MPGSIPAPQPANLKFHIYFMLSQGKKFLWSHLPVFQNHPTSLVSQCVCAQLLNHARLIGASWTLACQAPLPMEFSRQEHWSGLPFPSPEDRPNPGIEFGLLRLLDWQVNFSLLHHLGSPNFTQALHKTRE